MRPVGMTARCWMLRALETGEPPDIPSRDHLRTLALREAVLTSARQHCVVEL